MDSKSIVQERKERMDAKNDARIKLHEEVNAMCEAGYSYADIADKLGLSKSTIRLIVHAKKES